MAILRRIAGALLTVALLAPGPAGAASTTNFSDQWWIQDESGWGASVLQQSDVLFIDLFVYGADNKPTWFTAAAFRQGNSPAGHVLFTGELYSTTGPYYGAGTFNPGAVGYAKVGTLTFDADTVNTARLSYSVNGVPVVKDVTRQTWRNENIGGNYYGGLVYDQTSCADAIDNGHFEVFGELQFNHFADNTVTINARITSGNQNGIPLLVPAGLVFTMSGKYTQSGHMGQIQGTSSLMIPGEPPDTSVVQLFEIESSISGITGRYNSVDDKGGCRSSGHLGGVLR